MIDREKTNELESSFCDNNKAVGKLFADKIPKSQINVAHYMTTEEDHLSSFDLSLNK